MHNNSGLQPSLIGIYAWNTDDNKAINIVT